MELNATLWGQMLTFAFFVWFTMKYVWPILQANLKARENKIAEGLAAAERGHRELELAFKNGVQQMREARDKAKILLEQAEKQAAEIVEQAIHSAKQEKEKILNQGVAELEAAKRNARAGLEKDIIDLTVVTSEKLLHRQLTATDREVLLTLDAIK